MKVFLNVSLFFHDTLPFWFAHAKHRFMGTPLPYATVAENDFGAASTQELCEMLPAIDENLHPSDQTR